MQGINTSRVNINRLTNSSRDINRINHVADSPSLLPSGGTAAVVARDARSLLQTLQGSRAATRDPQQADTMDSPAPSQQAPTHVGRLDSVTSRSSLRISSLRPRNHCFHVEPVDDPMLHVISTAPNSSVGQNANCGMTNTSFVIDMSNSSLRDHSSRNVASDNNGTISHHIEFNTVPQIITPLDGPTRGETSAIQTTGDTEKVELLSEVNSDQNSSTESLQFIKPDSNQCTVTSLTPLLSRDSDSEAEATSGAGVSMV